MVAPPLLEIADLSFRYRRATEPALRNLSLTLEAGEVLLVAGPSGCGKSTLIRAINGLIPHSYRGELLGAGPAPSARGMTRRCGWAVDKSHTAPQTRGEVH